MDWGSWIWTAEGLEKIVSELEEGENVERRGGKKGGKTD